MTVFQSFVLVSLLVPYDRPLFIRIFYGLGNEKAKYREYLFSTEPFFRAASPQQHVSSQSSIEMTGSRFDLAYIELRLN